MQKHELTHDALQAAATEWVNELWDDPGDVTLEDLADTFPWKNFLNSLNHAPLYSYMGLKNQGGILFTGPVGNGKHTQAEAMVTSIVGKNIMDPEDLERVIVGRIDPKVLDPELPPEVLGEYVSKLYEISDEFIQDGTAEYVAVIFDELERYPVSLMVQIANAVKASDPRKRFTVCITEHEDRVIPVLKRDLLHCRCSNPSRSQRITFLKNFMEFDIVDYWSEPGVKTKKKMVIQFSGISMEEIAAKTEGFGYKNLEELVYLLKMMVVGKGTRTLIGTYDILVELSKTELLHCLALVEPIVQAPVQVALGGYGPGPVGPVASGPEPGPGRVPAHHSDPSGYDENDPDNMIKYIIGNDPDTLMKGV